ncbi:GNAT family N-acetyltransferase [Rhizobium oryzicola]|uniref:GNAT family N-acetyltransferase n=1 Tax=Rhizobium oryzicola TaxID=1232668 RepID=A0ABT8T359_9HYPH|nr:GNAT family N-acetyltransferase [Rhizobium oryzicola]MDO1584573.1 GNAT family N-acetyltransferase [Rhizobium oryzicola]
MAVSITIVTQSEKAELRKLLADHLATMNAYADVGPDYRFFDLYWTETQTRWPFWICRDGAIAGFALINTWSPSGLGTDYSMAEFYIVPEARRQGLGAQALLALTQQHPGRWEFGVLEKNAPALAFWPKAIAAAGARDVATTSRGNQIIYRFLITS